MDLSRTAGAAMFGPLLDAMPDAVVVVDGDGRIVLANRTAEALSGYAREELIGMPVEQLVPDGVRPGHSAHREAYQRAPAPRSMGGHLDIRFQRRDGSEFPADIALSPMRTDAGPLVVASVRDITERKRSEAELLQAQERFRLVIEGVRDHGVFMLDRDGRVSSWSPAAARISGHRADEILGRHFSVFYPEEDVAAGRPERELAEAAADGRYQEEGWRLRKDGSRYWADVEVAPIRDGTGELVGFAKITRDVTARKRQDDRLKAVLEIAEASLSGRDERALLELVASRGRALLDAELGVVLAVDDDARTIVVAAADGPGAEAIRERRAPMPAGTPPIVGADGHPSPAVQEILSDGLAAVVRLGTGEREFGGLAVANLLEPRGVSETDRRLLEVFAVQASVDIDYARVREELQRLAVLEDRERIGRELHDGAIQALFAVGISLQAMAGMTADPSLQRRLREAVGRVDGIIRDLRGYIFGLRPGLAASMRLGRTLRDLGEQLERQSGVACAVQIQEEIVPRLANRAADIVQVAREALSNVARHAGATTCRLSLLAEPDGGAALEIDDDGRGFAPSERAGGGWGMRNLRERAAAMGGSLEIHSVAGEGTTVRLLIPL
jgi:PAS domain S-box-containing protein